METEMIPVENGIEIRMARSPETVLAEAKLCAKALGRMVEQTKAFTIVGGRKHLHFTAWQTLGSMFRVTPRVRETRYVDYGGVRGFECVAEAFHVPSGQVVSVAESQCLNDEANWNVRPSKNGEVVVPMFQLRSMAQTRACAKALRNVLSWVVVLAGYEATPAEEMTDHDAHPAAAETRPAQPVQPPREKVPAQENGNGGAKTISGKQASRIWALGFSQGVDKKVVGQILRQYGFERAEDVTSDKYEEICAAVEHAGAGAAS
jgi:hypothetical protein